MTSPARHPPPPPPRGRAPRLPPKTLSCNGSKPMNRTGVQIRLVMIDNASVALRIMWRRCSTKRRALAARYPIDGEPQPQRGEDDVAHRQNGPERRGNPNHHRAQRSRDRREHVHPADPAMQRRMTAPQPRPDLRHGGHHRNTGQRDVADQQRVVQPERGRNPGVGGVAGQVWRDGVNEESRDDHAERGGQPRRAG